MPTIERKWDWYLIQLLLSVYDEGSWADGLSERDRPESHADGGVELVATRISDGSTLAIEHTRIEPFVGERNDFYKRFRPLQKALMADDALKVPGFAIYVYMPVGTLPHGSDWGGIIDDVRQWIRAERFRFPAKKSSRRCPCPHHPDGELLLEVRTVPLGESSEAAVIVHRYGEMHWDESIGRALRDKLPKLTNTAADRRLLLLERDQPWLHPREIVAEVERRRVDYPELADVHEVWCVDTAGFDKKGPYVAFYRPASSGLADEMFEFHHGRLVARFKNGVPVAIPRVR